MIKIIEKYGEGLLSREMPEEEREAVRAIVGDVRARGDEALFEYTKRFDDYCLTAGSVRVAESEIEAAVRAAPGGFLAALRRAADNIRSFHEKQRRETWLDVSGGRITGQLVRPLASCGVYIPGGRAVYPSSVLMNVLPAKVAGVPRVVITTPPGRDGGVSPLVLAAAREAGADEIYRVGGAQAIAALAFGTKSIPRVDKITGPGNIYVALAKREVFGYAGIDMIAGPSEVLIIADEGANPKYIAADLLSQAEHDPRTGCLLVTPSRGLAKAVSREIEAQLAALPRRATAAEAIDNYGAIVLVKDANEAFDVANAIAPEHLEIMLPDALSWLGSVRNAGAVFLGEHSPEPLGDYFAGPNHTLPTGGTARFFSPLGVDDFVKKTSVIRYSRSELESAADDIQTLAGAEGFSAHAAAVAVRFKEE